MADTTYMSTQHTIKDSKTIEALEALPTIYATDGMKGDRPAVKLFDAQGQAFWVIWEYDPQTKEGFGYADLGVGFGEIGYISITLLDELGIRIERDIWTKTMVEGYKSRGQSVPDYLLGETA